MADWRPSSNEWGANDREWIQLARQLKSGKCTPFIGAGACYGRLPSAQELSKELAKDFEYPFTDPHELTRVAQFGVWRCFGSIPFKEHVAGRLNHSTPPPSGPTDVHNLLAGYPLPIYITTNYDDLLFEALIDHGKEPVREHYSWYSDESSSGRKPRPGRIPPPTAEHPLVYHLHGTGTAAHGMVISEADYHVYLAKLALESVGDNWSLPAPIIGALAKRSLLFVGYSLQDWTFRVLFHGLIKPMADVLRHGNVSVQIAPDLVDDDEQTLASAKDYLRDYFGDLKVSVFWGGSDAFFTQLSRYA